MLFPTDMCPPWYPGRISDLGIWRVGMENSKVRKGFSGKQVALRGHEYKYTLLQFASYPALSKQGVGL